jgi:hypothetical protein
MIPATSALRIIKIVHTWNWAFFDSWVLAIPIFTWHGEYANAAVFIGIVFVEILLVFFSN